MFAFGVLPTDLWVYQIIPRLEHVDLVRLASCSAECRSFFRSGRLKSVLGDVAFSEYLTRNEWLEYLRSLGVFCDALSIDTRIYASTAFRNGILSTIKNQIPGNVFLLFVLCYSISFNCLYFIFSFQIVLCFSFN
jgi:hypothetical protein